MQPALIAICLAGSLLHVAAGRSNGGHRTGARDARIHHIGINFERRQGATARAHSAIAEGASC